MSPVFDVQARLAEGAAAVDTLQTYVSASRMRGYSHPDLTSSDGQVRHWYGMQDGLDLDLLESDCFALRSAVTEARDALERTRSDSDQLVNSWRGAGGDTTGEFLRRHSGSAESVVQRLDNAIDACGRLRDELWRLIDHQVGETVSVDEAAQVQRGEWLAAAHSVLSGGTEGAEVIDNQVKPFVDSVIRGQWMVAMRSIADDVAAAYRRATATIEGRGGVWFDIPADLGPRRSAPVGDGRAAAVIAAATPGMAQEVPVVSPVAGPAPVISSAGEPATGMPLPNPLDTWASGLRAPLMGGIPGTGLGSLPDLGAVTGVPAQLGELLDGGDGQPADVRLPDLGSSGDAVDPVGDAEAPGDRPEEPEQDGVTGEVDGGKPAAEDETGEPGDAEDEAGEPGDAEPEAGNAGCADPSAGETGCAEPEAGETGEAGDAESAAGNAGCAEPEAGNAGESGDAESDTDTAETPVPEPEPVAPPGHPVAPPLAAATPEPVGDTRTPCEIAAEELPQAGE